MTDLNVLESQIDWQKVNGMVPAVVQDAVNGRVLMVAFMDKAALAKTIATQKVTFLSRKSGQLWTKGETSGNWLTLVDIKIDCDNDTLLVLANPAGPTCHEGTTTCFGDAPVFTHGFISQLEEIITARAGEGDAASYTAKLLNGPLSRVAQKVGEEGLEVALAAVGAEEAEFLGEAADLLYHLLVCLKARDTKLQDVCAVLADRHAQKAPTK
jgi:phosphoribosyl-ATP pyrophosphohydrolase/phosphoribosyl-AMP cyclohydrolase